MLCTRVSHAIDSGFKWTGSMITCMGPFFYFKKKKKSYVHVKFVRIRVHLTKIIFVNLFYYSAYFCYYSWSYYIFLLLFMGLIILFQLIFTFIYNTFSKKKIQF